MREWLRMMDEEMRAMRAVYGILFHCIGNSCPDAGCGTAEKLVRKLAFGRRGFHIDMRIH